MASESAQFKPNGYRYLAEEEVVAVQAMSKWVKDRYKTMLKFQCGTSFPLGSSMFLYPLQEFKRLSDICYGMIHLYENDDSKEHTRNPQNPYQFMQTTSLSNRNRLSKRRLAAISAACDIENLRRVDYLTFQAWFLHHLGVEPSVCGIEEKYYRHLKHLSDSDEVVPLVEPLFKQNGGLDGLFGVTRRRLSDRPSEDAPQMNHKRIRLSGSQGYSDTRPASICTPNSDGGYTVYYPGT